MGDFCRPPSQMINQASGNEQQEARTRWDGFRLRIGCPLGATCVSLSPQLAGTELNSQLKGARLNTNRWERTSMTWDYNGSASVCKNKNSLQQPSWLFSHCAPAASPAKPLGLWTGRSLEHSRVSHLCFSFSACYTRLATVTSTLLFCFQAKLFFLEHLVTSPLFLR